VRCIFEMEEWTACDLICCCGVCVLVSLVCLISEQETYIPCEIVLIMNNPMHELGAPGMNRPPHELLEELWLCAVLLAREIASV
jgi:hypothetical protein